MLTSKHVTKITYLVIICMVMTGAVGYCVFKQRRHDEQIKTSLEIHYAARGKDLQRFYVNVNEGYKKNSAYIAHGGGIAEFIYTNCREAIEDSLWNQKFEYIEIDLIETSDGKILGAHDWKHFRGLTGQDKNSQPMSSERIKQLLINGKYSPLLGEDINNYME